MLFSQLARVCRSLSTGRNHRRCRCLNLAASEALESRQLLSATAIQAMHRSGQTFITWTEDAAVTGEEYHVYRSSSPITTANLAQAQKLTNKWGPLDDNTSVHQYAAPGTGVPATFVISDLGMPLAASKGLFVYTTPAAQAGSWYYAVTQLTNGVEGTTITGGANSLSSSTSGIVATPQPVLTVSTNGGKGRIYTQYMDYAKWNPTFEGYAFNYSVALPDNYDPAVAWPLKLMPHAYGERFRMEPSAEYGWPLIEVFVDDSGGTTDTWQTWWYGFAADHNYKTNGQIPTSGVIENFTEQRVLKAIDEVIANFSVDPQKVHAQGHSMGASGSLSLGMRYPSVFSGIFASEPMTNYGSSPGFQNDFTALWGSQASNLPIVNRGPHASQLQQYDGTGIYNWMNHHEQLVSRRGDDMAFLMVGHGKADDVIDWATQGRPFIAALNAGNIGFTGEQRAGWDHNWMSFDFALDSMFSPTDGGLSAWAYPKSYSFPAITNATGSGPNVPGSTGIDFYNMKIEWSVPWNAFHADVIDIANRYEITLRSTVGAQLAEVTPRRLQAFSAPAGSVVTWQNINNANGQIVQSGTITSDPDGLVTIPRVQIGTGTGNRLVLTVEAAKPEITAPIGATSSQTPQLIWTAVKGAASYDVWISNLSTGQSPQLQVNVAGTNYTPTAALGIGRYRMWVRSRSTGNQPSAWSAAKDFQITTAPVTGEVASPVYSGMPLISWSPLTGAANYDLWINNTSTGQSQVIRQQSLTTNSYQVPASLGLGTHTFWVRGIDADGVAGDWSVSRQFMSAARVTPTTPNGPTFSTQPTLQWQAVSGANRYEVSVVNRPTNAVVLSQSGITGTNWTPVSSLPNGNYRWWVRASSTVYGIVGGWSIHTDFNTGGKPTVLTPAGTTNDRTPTISWTAVQGAARYELWVSRIDGGGVIINLTNLTANSYTPTTSLVPRAYRIWVRAVSTTGTMSDWSAPVDLTIL